MTAVRAAAAIARKDLLTEWRGRESVYTLAQFAVLALLVANFGFDLDSTTVPHIAPGILWLSVVFAALLTCGRAFSIEQEQASMEAVLLTPAGRTAILLGKATVAGLMLLIAETVLVLGLAFFFDIPAGSPTLWGALILGTIGMAAVGALFAALVAQVRSRELLLPALTIPLWIPIVVAGGRAVQIALGAGGTGEGQALGILLSVDTIYVVVVSLLARFVLDD